MAPRITVKELLKQIERIPSEWLNKVGEKVIQSIPKVLRKISERAEVDQAFIEELLREDRYSLDVFRLFLELSQDELANELNRLGLPGEFTSIRKRIPEKAPEVARALIEVGLLDAIATQRDAQWELGDILLERYKYQRGRAIKGQKRGRSLEDDVKAILDELALSYVQGRSFVGRKGIEAKADFSIASERLPQVVIEVKGYEATGSKQTDVLGDIQKILKAKDPETHFYFVTDGVGWFRRISDLRHVVAYHESGDITMIYTRKMLPALKEELKQIFQSGG